MNKHNKIYITPKTYNDAVNFDSVWHTYINGRRSYNYKKDVPKNARYVFVLKFFPDSGDLEYWQRIK